MDPVFVAWKVHLLIAVSGVAAVFDLALAAFVLRHDPRARANRVFAVLCVVCAIWAVSYAFLLGAEPEHPTTGLMAWQRLAALGYGPLPALLGHFLLLLPRGRSEGLPYPWLALLYAPLPLVLVEGLLDPTPLSLAGFRPSAWGWVKLFPRLGPDMLFHLVYLALAAGAGFAAVHRWGRRSARRRERRTAQIVVRLGVIGLALGLVSVLGDRLFGGAAFPDLPHLVMSSWVGGIAYAMVRYQLMVLTPAAVADRIVETLQDGILLLDPEGRIAEVNPAARRLLGWTREALLGERLDACLALGEGGGPLPEVLGRLAGRSVEIEAPAVGCPRVPVSLVVSAAPDEHGDPLGWVAMLRDLSEERRAREALTRAATHDSLTGLPNRELLDERAERALKRSRRNDGHAAFVLFDLDDFKAINDTYGHAAGDRVLRRTAEVLTGAMRATDTVFRLGGDEFLLLAEAVGERRDVERIAERIRSELGRPVEVGGAAVPVVASIGAALHPDDGEDLDVLLHHADLALYRSKEEGDGRLHFFSGEIDDVHRRRLELEADLARAVERGELELLYQPLLALDGERVVAMEALLRWRSPSRGALAPGEFLAVAEASGAIVGIGAWVLAEACRRSAGWQREGMAAVPVAVNLSARQLRHPALPEQVEAALEGSGLAPELLQLELRDTSVAAEPEPLANLCRLARRGVRVVVDDLGGVDDTLTALRDLPIRGVKIDRRFVASIAEDPRGRALVAAVTAMAHELGLEVVAQGVESGEQLEALRRLTGGAERSRRCDHVQGFLFGRPVPAEEVRAWVAGTPAATGGEAES